VNEGKLLFYTSYELNRAISEGKDLGNGMNMAIYGYINSVKDGNFNKIFSSLFRGNSALAFAQYYNQLDNIGKSQIVPPDLQENFRKYLIEQGLIREGKSQDNPPEQPELQVSDYPTLKTLMESGKYNIIHQIPLDAS